ncbi:MAG: beta-propeller domain-containing protein [Candidatus Diapherotrites archaeon]
MKPGEKMKNDSKKAVFFIAVVLIACIAMIGLLILSVKPSDSNGDSGAKPSNLQRFKDYAELSAYFEKARNMPARYYAGDIFSIGMPLMSSPQKMVQAESAVVPFSGEAVEYSTTNIQVEGVDEADIIKTDGKYAYAIARGKLYIIEAYPAESAKVVSETTFSSETPRELFVSGNKLLVFSDSYGGGYKCPLTAGTAKKCFGYSSGIVSARLYNISDKENPVLEKEMEFEGSYLNSRLIGKHAYFVINSYSRYYDYEKDANSDIIPQYRVGGENGTVSRIAEPEQIGYIPNIRPESFVTIVSLNLESQEMQKETIAASGSAIYASQKNLYISAPVWNWREEPVPLKSGGLVREIVWPRPSAIEQTSISKFSLENGKISFVAEGIVPGHILNQFSMDEFEEHFRIATTIGEVSRGGSSSTNNIYVLDSEMKLAGKIEGLAPGEKIYSARFMGKKGYLVTFKKVDPLFVVDLSDPKNPKVLGKLKIPGYSDYLHPIDETHIIGLGKETIESTYGDFAWYQGIKMAIFDVSDPENPKEMSKVVIGDRGTESYALHDHKAFLFDKKRELLVIPVMLAEIPEEQKSDIERERVSPTYGQPVFQGAFVFKVSLESGITERGRITHVSKEEELKRGYYYGDNYSVKRSFYIGNVLYTFSDSMLKANNLDTLEGISSVALSQGYYYGGYYE